MVGSLSETPTPSFPCRRSRQEPRCHQSSSLSWLCSFPQSRLGLSWGFSCGNGSRNLASPTLSSAWMRSGWSLVWDCSSSQGWHSPCSSMAIHTLVGSSSPLLYSNSGHWSPMVSRHWTTRPSRVSTARIRPSSARSDFGSERRLAAWPGFGIGPDLAANAPIEDWLGLHWTSPGYAA